LNLGKSKTSADGANADDDDGREHENCKLDEVTSLASLLPFNATHQIIPVAAPVMHVANYSNWLRLIKVSGAEAGGDHNEKDSDCAGGSGRRVEQRP
jgi:hypothetical protein